MTIRYQTPDSRCEPRPLAADEWKPDQVREIRIDPPTEGVGGIRGYVLQYNDTYGVDSDGVDLTE